MPPHTKILARSASPSADRGDRQAKGPRSTLKDVLLLQLPDQAIDFIEAFLLNARREGFRLVGLARENRGDELSLARGLKLDFGHSEVAGGRDVLYDK
jgi:hypothetical protein